MKLVSGSLMPPDLAHAKSGWFVNFENLGNVQPVDAFEDRSRAGVERWRRWKSVLDLMFVNCLSAALRPSQHWMLSSAPKHRLYLFFVFDAVFHHVQSRVANPSVLARLVLLHGK